MTEIYRRRLIPDECIHLNGDKILIHNDKMLLTSWRTLHPKDEFATGLSLYLLENGWKISKFFDDKGNFVEWYCDIIRHDYDKIDDSYVFTDLLADVIIEKNGFVRIADLDELADAYENRLISGRMMSEAVRKLNNLLDVIYSGVFKEYTAIIEQHEQSHLNDNLPSR